MAYIDVWNLRCSTNLKSRVAVAIAKASQDVLNEAGTTANHAARIIWAQASLADALSAAERMMWGVVGNATIAAAGDACTDNDVQFVVNGLIDTFAK